MKFHIVKLYVVGTLIFRLLRFRGHSNVCEMKLSKQSSVFLKLYRILNIIGILELVENFFEVIAIEKLNCLYISIQYNKIFS